MATDFGALADQGPAQAWTRYLAGIQGGTPFSSTIRDLLEERGRLLSYMAPMAGYGFDAPDAQGGGSRGGMGRDFKQFYDMQGRQPGNMMGYLRNAAGNAKRYGQQQAAENRRSGGYTLTPEETDLLNNPQSAFEGTMGEYYSDDANQLRASQAAMGLQANPFWRSSLNSMLGRRFEQQQAMNPNQSWFDYMKQAWLM